MFNTLIIYDYICPNCNKTIDLKIQFKYGELALYKYKLGDYLIWDEYSIRYKTNKKVVVSSIAEECLFCDFNEEFLIYVINNKIDSFQFDDGRYHHLFMKIYQYHLVLNDR